MAEIVVHYDFPHVLECSWNEAADGSSLHENFDFSFHVDRIVIVP